MHKESMFCMKPFWSNILLLLLLLHPQHMSLLYWQIFKWNKKLLTIHINFYVLDKIGTVLCCCHPQCRNGKFKDWPDKFQIPVELFNKVQGYYFGIQDNTSIPKEAQGWNPNFGIHELNGCPYIDQSCYFLLWKHSKIQQQQ